MSERSPAERAYDARRTVNEDECPNGDPYCGGLEAMLDGDLPCLECLAEAPAEVVAKMNAKRKAREANVATVERGDSL